jgi:hypothetical protein
MTPATTERARPERRRVARARRWAWLGGGTLALFGVVAWLHTPMARPLLMRLGGCPMAGARMTVAQMETARRLSVAHGRGTTNAPSRPALGFALDATTLAEVHAWAAREHLDCEDARAGFITCKNVAPLAVGRSAGEGPLDELDLGFDAREHLVNVTTLRAHMSPAVAAQAARDIATRLDGLLGPADKATGAFDALRLARGGAESLAAVQYRYRDYFADVATMTLPSSGPSVREHYMSARD